MNNVKSILICFSLIFIVGCTTIYNPATKQQELYFINQTTEVDIGKNMAQKIINNNRLITDTAKNERLRTIADKIVTVSDRTSLDYHFYLLDKPGINAFALPGGFIFVHSGALDKVDNQQLAFILAHEVGHVAARHSIKRLQASIGTQLVLGVALRGTDSNILNRCLSIVYNVVALGYSRQDELLADSLAVEYSAKAGYQPQAGIKLMQQLAQESENKYSLVFLSSHPQPSQRINNIRQKIAALPASLLPHGAF
jgi:predicted Zn-dependent protease